MNLVVFAAEIVTFGVGASPNFQRAHVAASGLAPSYEAELLDFDPHDYQHFVRYTHGAKVLVWLTNDAVAKDDLLMQSENFHLAFHDKNYNSGGAFQGTGMKSRQLYVASQPGSALDFGRGEAWGFECAAATYAFADQDWRNDKLDWFRDLTDLMAAAQIPCNGFIQGVVHPKFLGGKYRVRQQIEHSIMENMFQSVRESVFRNADVTYDALMKDVLSGSLRAFASPLVFAPGFSAPRSQSAVGPVDPMAAPFCFQSQIPSDGYSPYTEAYQDWSCFAFGYEITGDPIFLTRALSQIGGGDLYTRMINGGLNNIENRASLLALVQRLNGDI